VAAGAASAAAGTAITENRPRMTESRRIYVQSIPPCRCPPFNGP
jgi:hypothetical protein